MWMLQIEIINFDSAKPSRVTVALPKTNSQADVENL